MSNVNGVGDSLSCLKACLLARARPSRAHRRHPCPHIAAWPMTQTVGRSGDRVSSGRCCLWEVGRSGECGAVIVAGHLCACMVGPDGRFDGAVHACRHRGRHFGLGPPSCTYLCSLVHAPPHRLQSRMTDPYLPTVNHTVFI